MFCVMLCDFVSPYPYLAIPPLARRYDGDKKKTSIDWSFFKKWLTI